MPSVIRVLFAQRHLRPGQRHDQQHERAASDRIGRRRAQAPSAASAALRAIGPTDEKIIGADAAPAAPDRQREHDGNQQQREREGLGLGKADHREAAPSGPQRRLRRRDAHSRGGAPDERRCVVPDRGVPIRGQRNLRELGQIAFVEADLASSGRLPGTLSVRRRSTHSAVVISSAGMANRRWIYRRSTSAASVAMILESPARQAGRSRRLSISRSAQTPGGSGGGGASQGAAAPVDPTRQETPLPAARRMPPAPPPAIRASPRTVRMRCTQIAKRCVGFVQTFNDPDRKRGSSISSREPSGRCSRRTAGGSVNGPDLPRLQPRAPEPSRGSARPASAESTPRPHARRRRSTRTRPPRRPRRQPICGIGRFNADLEGGAERDLRF
jgi:hypothetical protein